MAIPTRTVTRDDALDLMRAAVTEKGADYVYPADMMCTYFSEDAAPACIVGHVFARLGLTAEDLQYNNEGTGVEDAVLGLQVHHPDFHVTDDAIAVMAAAQDAQDSRFTWGKALESAVAADSDYQQG